MAVQIFNEGRVVGYSAYEVYIKQHLAENPKDSNGNPILPASERQWLASTIATGSSMLLRVPRTPTNLLDEEMHHYVDIDLPDMSNLGAANTIIGSFFDGEAEFESADSHPSTFLSAGWATKVTDYGSLISNDSTASPTTDIYENSDVPTQAIEDWSQAKKARLRDYMKIVDGIVLQPGVWSSTGSVPEKDLHPNMGGRATVRLHIKGTITSDVYILLTGFTVKYVLSGVAGMDGSTDPDSPGRKPEDGDFLGPAVYPWANKIVFSVPTSYITYFMSGAYKRQLESDTTPVAVHDTAVIDMKSPSQSAGSYTAIFQPPVLENYFNTGVPETDTLFYPYTSTHQDATDAQALLMKQGARVQDDVSDYSTLGDGTAVITVYQKKSIYPPALYGTFVDSIGIEYLHAIDSVAPGSIKMFTGNPDTISNIMLDYEDTFPGTTSMCKDEDGSIYVINKSGEVVPVVKLDMENIVVSGSGSTNLKKAIIEAGKNKAILMSLQTDSSLNANQVTISTTPPNNITTNNITHNNKVSWYGLIKSLETNSTLDVLESRLADAKSTLIKAENQGVSAPYLEFGPDNNKRRLYISSVAPETTDVPVGSIGIGWGFETSNNA